MKKYHYYLFVLCAILLSTLMLFSCGDETQVLPEEGTVTRMTIDINPSIELMIDDQNKVISATALNDDGSILIAGEALVGKTPEEATEVIVSLAVQTGYLVKGDYGATENPNTVIISVSGDSHYADQLSERLEERTNALLKKADIQGMVKKMDALALESLRSVALSTSLYTEEEIGAMNEQQLYDVIAAGRVETALLLTQEMREAYYIAKEHKISFAESEETAKVIESLGGLYTLTHTAYKAALDVYSAAIMALDDFRYETLVSPDSAYQKSVSVLRDAKVELLKQRTYTASLEVNGTEYASASATLQMKEETYNQALAAYEGIGKQANEQLQDWIEQLRQAEIKLRELEQSLFDDAIEQTLNEKALEIESNLNAVKDAFFTEFEDAHGEDIAAVEASLVARKQALIESIENGGQ